MGDRRSDKPDVSPAHAALLKGFSIEILPTDQRSVEDARSLLAAGTEVFLAAPPSQPVHAQVEVAKILRHAGLTPFPHIPARSIASLEDLDVLLARLESEAGVDRVLVLAGDRGRPVGDLSSSLQIIRSGLLPRHGIHTIAIPGYPEGHPRISEPDLRVSRREAGSEPSLRLECEYRDAILLRS